MTPSRRKAAGAVLTAATWAGAAAITAVTLSPIEARPTTTLGADTERVGAFLVLGALAALAYPRHRRAVTGGSLALIVGLEAAQL